MGMPITTACADLSQRQEKGCIDLSTAGELGVADAYSVISKYCEEERR